MHKKDYDLVVIGGGPAGITGATTAAGFGKSVALIDGHRELGGARFAMEILERSKIDVYYGPRSSRTITRY